MKQGALKAFLILSTFAWISLASYGQNYIPARPYGEENLIPGFLCDEMEYPTIALEKGEEGTVILQFIVTDKGEVEDLEVKQSVSPEVDAEAIRLFRMLLWEPAEKLQVPVTSINEFPIRFSIKKYKKHCKSRGYDHTIYPYKPVDTSYIVYSVSQLDKPPQPVFSDNTLTLSKFINDNIKYPETAYRQNIAGKVELRFVVEPQGRVTNVRVTQPVSGGCSQEAIRLLSLLHWMPGIKDNEAVRCFMTMEINFKLPEDTDLKMFENSQMNSN